MRNKTERFKSIIWSLSKEEFATLIKDSNTFSAVLNYFGLSNKGGNNITLHKRITAENVDISHIIKNRYSPRLTFTKATIESAQKYLIAESTTRRGVVRCNIIKFNLLPYKCSICNLDSWQNKKLSLQLDHINGVHNDHRIENLRFLCPNCHSQTDTFAGRANKKLKVKRDRHSPCVARRKVKERPSKEEVYSLLETMSYCAVGRKYGVSDNAVRKWLK